MRALASFATLLLASGSQLATAVRSDGDHNGDTVHIVFSNHLDVGFGGINPELGFDNNVINMYFDWYIPTAIRMGQYFEQDEGPESHVYTMMSYIASLYMSCPSGMGLHCPTATQQEEFCQAARDGHITWTAFPYNGQVEMMDEETIIGAIQLTRDLDHLCGVRMKTVISQRDVPGMTRGAIPVFSQSWSGPAIRAVSVGVNGGSATPGVPLNAPFIWRDAPSDTSVLAFWHPGGYGGKSQFQGKTIRLTPAEDCLRTPPDASGNRNVLCFSWRGDNDGPYEDPNDVRKIFAAVRERFPGATVRASTFESFIDVLEPFKGSLEVVTGEIGDTWIHGVASDPVKVKNYRAMMRMRSQCLYDGACVVQSPSFQNSTRFFLKIPEHTWGIDTKTAPASWDTWENEAFRKALDDNELFALAERSWVRQNNYVSWSLQALDASDMTASHGEASPADAAMQAFGAAAKDLLAQFERDPVEAEARVHAESLPELLQCTHAASTHSTQHGRDAGAAAHRESMHARGLGVHSEDVEDEKAETPPELPKTWGNLEVGAGLRCGPGGEVILDADGWFIAVDPASGEINSIFRTWPDEHGNKHPGTDWAAGGIFAQPLYTTYSTEYFQKWGAGYNPIGAAGYEIPWTRYDFGNPVEPQGLAKDRTARPELISVNKYSGQYEEQVGIALKFKFVGWPVDEAGAPPMLTQLVHTWKGSDAVMVDIIYNHKLPTRLPEALWLRFAPAAAAADAASMRISKVSSLISPLEVMVNGSHNLHAAMDGGIHMRSMQHEWEQLQVAAMDTALVAIGEPEVLPDIRGPAAPEKGFSFNLFNNAWGTNYVMWTPYGDGIGSSIKSRFVVSVRDVRSSGPAATSLLKDPHLQSVPRHLLL